MGHRIAILSLALLVLWIPEFSRADGEGSATIEPDKPVLAGAHGTWTITYRPGAQGMKPGGGIRLALSGFPIQLFARPQCTDPTSANYTTAYCTNAAIPVSVQFVEELRSGWMRLEEVQVTVGATGLTASDALIVVYGDTSAGGPGGSVRGMEGDGLPIRISSDSDGNETYAPLATYPRLTLVGGSAASLVVFAPSQAVVGEPLSVAVSLRDGRNAVATQALPRVTLSGPGVAEPVTLDFAEGARAYKSATVIFRKPGVHRLIAAPSAPVNNPVVVERKAFVTAARSDAEPEPGFCPELTWIKVSATRARPGSTLRLETHWRNIGTQAATHDYRIMCHLQRRPAAGRALANWDHAPSVPTTQWVPGKTFTSRCVGAIPANIPPGKHALVLGLYYSPDPGKFVVPVTYDVCWIEVGPEEPLITDLAPARSNPIEVLTTPPARRLLWGDLHCHTENSGDGSGMTEALYKYARDVARLDFCACTDHVSWNYPAEQWQQIRELAHRYNDPGRFVSILGYEWSNVEHGDKNVYFVQDGEDIRVPQSGEAEDLWSMLKGVDCIVIPHHPAYPVGLRGTDWGRIDESLVPVVEMCSNHGLGEYFGNPRPYGKNKPMGPSLPGGFAQDALARGLHLGFICSSDDHSAHAGKIGFLCAVYADSFDRAGIIEALRQRHCYGTTGARILIDLRANGELMGSVLRCQEPPTLSVRTHGTEKLQLVEIVKDGEVCYTIRPAGESCQFDYQPTALDRPESYYYVRVTQTDGELGWSSPLFIRNMGPLPELVVEDVQVAPVPQIGAASRITVRVRNKGRATSGPATLRLTVGEPPAWPIAREKPPTRSGIGGLMATPGLQLWRWPVDETSLNVFVRWGGGEQGDECAGEIRLINVRQYIMTPFHAEEGDRYEDDGGGVIRWQTNAEPGTGDGLNLWIRIDLHQQPRLTLDATRAGKRRPAEIFVHGGAVVALPCELPLTDYDPARWIGEIELSALNPGEERKLEMEWTPTEIREGEVQCQVISE
ncbi:MAG: CehA/McbA family metallohydrolase [Candidatus Zipacnadales bacterium]